MEYEAQDIVNQLATRIGMLEVELAMSNAKNKKINERYVNLQQEVTMLQEDCRMLREQQNESN